MRRNEKEIKDRAVIETVLRSGKICRLGLVDGPLPYIVPMNYGYENNVIFLHSALEGKKTDILKANNNVCIEVSDSITIAEGQTACSYGTCYRSVLCFGKAESIADNSEKLAALDVIMKQQTGRDNWTYGKEAVSKISVYKIMIESLTGKISRL